MGVPKIYTSTYLFWDSTINLFKKYFLYTANKEDPRVEFFYEARMTAVVYQTSTLAVATFS